MAVIDAYTHYVLQFMEAINKTSQKTMRDLVSLDGFQSSPRFLRGSSEQFDSYDVNKIGSHPGVRDDLFKRPLDQSLITDFFGGVAQAEVVSEDEIRSLPDPSAIDDTQGETLRVTPRREIKSASSVLRTVLSQSQLSGPRHDRWRDARAWASLLLVVMLVGWVSWRGK